jgi:hypothetical protein
MVDCYVSVRSDILFIETILTAGVLESRCFRVL